MDTLEEAAELASRIANEAPTLTVVALVRYAEWWEAQVYTPTRVLYVDSAADWDNVRQRYTA